MLKYFLLYSQKTVYNFCFTPLDNMIEIKNVSSVNPIA